MRAAAGRGRNDLFVAGIDGQGEYVLLIGGQDGLPEDCPYALRHGGRDWGDAIEAQGLLWLKANGFKSLNGSSLAVGEDPRLTLAGSTLSTPRCF
jgi:hypothetical protein